MAYANALEQEAAKFHDGWLYIGDLATWDEHEYVTIVGRKDDMIVSGGENVHPVQVAEAPRYRRLAGRLGCGRHVGPTGRGVRGTRRRIAHGRRMRPALP